MLDIKKILNNFDFFLDNLKKRESYDLSNVNEIKIFDKKRKELISELELLQRKRNEIAKQNSVNKEQIIEEAKNIKISIQKLEENLRKIEDDLQNLMLQFPNTLQDSVPYIENKLENVIISKFLEPTKFSFNPLDHVEIGKKYGFDFDRAVKMSGTRFCISHGMIRKLERALERFMLSVCLEFGYEEYLFPLLLTKESATRAGQLPKFEEDIFKTTDGKYLISTSEMSAANLYADEFIEKEKFPIRICSFSPCFRSEAGSAGKDTKGIIRQHQFYKMETFCIVEPEKSNEEHERMVQCSEEVLKRLKLPYQKILLCAQDTGFCASKTYDLEVWIPSQNCYREIASCSNTTDFQSRRSNIKFKDGDKKLYPHMLNASCLPIGRTVVAIIENCQKEDGSFEIPEILKDYI